MRKWNMKGTLPKKFMLALMLLVVSSVISIGVNYKSMGVFRFVHKKVPIYSVDTKEKKISVTSGRREQKRSFWVEIQKRTQVYLQQANWQF